MHSSDRLQPFNLSAPLISETLFNLKQRCEDQIIQKEARIGSSSTLGSAGRRHNKRESAKVDPGPSAAKVLKTYRMR